MKVLTFTSLYPNNIWPHHGVFVKERMTHVAALKGCEVKVVAPVPYFPPLRINQRWRFSQVHRQEVIEGLEVYHPRYVMIPKIGMALHGWLMFVSVLPTIRKIRRDFDFDLIDAHYVYPDGFAAILLGRYLHKPVVVSARGSDINLFKDFPLIRRLLQYTLNGAHKVIAVSGALKETMMQLGTTEEKICVIPNGVDARKFYPIPKEDARKQLELPTKRIMLSVGNLTANKGFNLLIGALKILIEEFYEKDLYLIIVGEGPLRKKLETQISSLRLDEHVKLVGRIPHQELYRWYSAADLFCLASAREGWPNVLLESLSCGTPVVATAVGGIPEIICSDEVGLLTIRNEKAIAEKIAFALKKPWHFSALLQYAEEHTWDRVALSLSRLFQSVLHDCSRLHAVDQKEVFSELDR
jgi:teichuronic acid biosynthesis glycosyltransferase TuaC